MPTVKLPVRVEHKPGGGVQIRLYGQDAGWAVVECDNVEQARQVMRDHPEAAMPCWRNPAAVWNLGVDVNDDATFDREEEEEEEDEGEEEV